MLFDEPIGLNFVEERRVPGSESTFCRNRQCVLCDHACLEFEWLCSCCSSIDHRGACSLNEDRISRPLLPPHWPKHARIRLLTVATIVKNG